MNLKIEKNKLLIVEGKDEVLFFQAMLRDHLHRDDVQVMGIGGKTLLRANLGALTKDRRFPDVASLAIIRDADASDPAAEASAAHRAWQSVGDSLVACNLPIPARHGLPVAGPPRTGVFIFPDGESDGMLESLCLAATADDPASRCVSAFFECLGNHPIPPGSIDKARRHAFLASRAVPDLRVGEAGEKGYWPWNAPAFAPLIDFIREI